MEESHFLTMMRMVQPHVSGRPKRSVELMLQSAELFYSVQQYKEPDLSACDTGQDFVDFEAMLTDLQTVCNPAESEFINLILNFFRSRKIYSAYRTAASQQNFQQTQTAQEDFQEGKDSVSMEALNLSEKENLSKTENLSEAENLSKKNSDTSALLSAAEKTETASMGKANNPNADKKRNRQGAANTFRNLMGNQALQSLLSPTQKENLNQIESLMQVLS